ncbi:hypothetical protein HY639_03490 [Candidatus Woesearchaeota archaeon]|nr:hypothetical protein [Candidatus Woesearchaeota archaeon]
MDVIVFGSGSGTNLEALLAAQQSLQQQGQPLYEIRAVVSDRLCRCLDIAQQAHIPVIHHDFTSFFRQHGVSDHADLSTRELYDMKTVQLLTALAAKEGFSLDLLALAGYMKVVHRPLLDAFPGKIINVHPADLSKTDTAGKRLYTGHKAVLAALRAGESKTYSCVHLVRQEVDAGEILVTSQGLDVVQGDTIKQRAQQQQDMQKRLCDWPAYVVAVTLIAQGRIALDTSAVYVDGVKMGPRGFELETITDHQLRTDWALRAAAFVSSR